MLGKSTENPYQFDGKNHGFKVSGEDFPQHTNPLIWKPQQNQQLPAVSHRPRYNSSGTLQGYSTRARSKGAGRGTWRTPSMRQRMGCMRKTWRKKGESMKLWENVV